MPAPPAQLCSKDASKRPSLTPLADAAAPTPLLLLAFTNTSKTAIATWTITTHCLELSWDKDYPAFLSNLLHSTLSGIEQPSVNIPNLLLGNTGVNQILEQTAFLNDAWKSRGA